MGIGEQDFDFESTKKRKRSTEQESKQARKSDDLKARRDKRLAKIRQRRDDHDRINQD